MFSLNIRRGRSGGGGGVFADAPHLADRYSFSRYWHHSPTQFVTIIQICLLKHRLPRISGSQLHSCLTTTDTLAGALLKTVTYEVA